jgi:hypothetical protein
MPARRRPIELTDSPAEAMAARRGAGAVPAGLPVVVPASAAAKAVNDSRPVGREMLDLAPELVHLQLPRLPRPLVADPFEPFRVTLLHRPQQLRIRQLDRHFLPQWAGIHV